MAVPMGDRMTVDVVEGPARLPSRRRVGRWTAGLLLAATALGLLWSRGNPSFVAWEVARDHERCFGRRRLPARLWTSDAGEVRDWLESNGTPVPPLPERAGNVQVVGVRYCPLADRVAAHIYYGGERTLVSVYVLHGPARVRGEWQGEVDDLHVRLVPSAGRTIAIVGSVESDVDAVAHAFTSSVARAPRAPAVRLTAAAPA
jgi:hypothetical protein